MGLFPAFKPTKTAGGMVMASGCGSSSGYPDPSYWGFLIKASINVYIEYPEKVLPGMPFTVNVYSIARGYYSGCGQRMGPNVVPDHDLFVSTPWGETKSVKRVTYGISGYQGGASRSAVKYPLRFIALTTQPFKLKFWARAGGRTGRILETPEIPVWRPKLGEIIQKIDSICTTVVDRKPFFELSTPYDLRGDLILRDVDGNEIFRERVDIMQGEGIDLNFSLDDMKEAIDNPRFVIVPVFHAKINDYWEEDITMDRVGLINLELPELQLEELRVSDNFCPNDVLEVTGVVRQIKCPSKVLARITSFDEELAEGVFDLKQGEVIDLKTDLDLNWDMINSISERHGLNIDNLKLPIKFELFRYTNEIEKRAGLATQDLVMIGSKMKEIIMKKPALLNVVNVQAPRKARPGYSTSVGITLENVGECPGEFNIKIGNFFETTDEFRPGERKSYTGTFVMGGEDFTPTGFITRMEGRTRREMPGITLPKILMVDTTALDTSKGLEIRAGDSEILFGGVMTGKNIGSTGGSRSIKEVYPLPEVPFMPNNIAILAGKVEPDGIETISADSVDYLKIKTSASLSYVLNGRVKNKDTDDIEYGGLSPARFVTEAVVGKDRIEEIISTFGGVV